MRGASFLTIGAIGSIAASACSADGHDVANRHPVHLRRPVDGPLSEVAKLGRELFFDTTLSASGRVSCASCHQPDQAYASNRLAGILGRAVPSLRYTYRTPNFTVGPVASEADEPIASASTSPPPPRPASRVKSAGATVDPTAIVARGGLFWDGRVNTLETQAMGPLFDPAEMGNRDAKSVADRIVHSSYARRFTALFGANVLAAPERLVDEAMFAVARYEIEDPSFHPYSSTYDAFLEGSATLTASEWRGLQAFDDRQRGNCAACHVDRPSSDGVPPAFTDYEYEALGVPRNTAHTGPPAPSDPYDVGVCGPARTDLRVDARYCGLFRTPSLRNTATRTRFFHNGVYQTLDDVLAFYGFRDTRPERIYPVDQHGIPRKFDDLPERYHGNVDAVDAPFDRKAGQAPPMSSQDMRDIVAFLQTLTDRDLRRHP